MIEAVRRGPILKEIIILKQDFFIQKIFMIENIVS